MIFFFFFLSVISWWLSDLSYYTNSLHKHKQHKNIYSKTAFNTFASVTVQVFVITSEPMWGSKVSLWERRAVLYTSDHQVRLLCHRLNQSGSWSGKERTRLSTNDEVKHLMENCGQSHTLSPLHDELELNAQALRTHEAVQVNGDI